MNGTDDGTFRDRIQRVETLLDELNRCADPAARAAGQEIVQTLLDYHGAGLARIVEHLAGADGGLLEQLAQDELVGSLLLLYGLHPLDLATRVRQALEKVQPALRARGGSAELLELTDGAVRVRLEAGGHGCQSTAKALRQAVEDAVYGAAPDVAALEIEGTPEPSGATFVPVEQLLVRQPAAAG